MRSIVRISALSLLLYLPGSALAWQPQFPVKIDAGVDVRFNVYFQDQPKPLAPWYLYWPAEAQQQISPQAMGMHYPNWPGQWPPPGANGADPKTAPTPPPDAPDIPFAPSGAPPEPLQSQPPQFTPPGTLVPAHHPFQPVGYYGQAPSYWYGK